MAGIPAAVLSILVTANTGGASAQLTRLDRRLKGTAATAEASGARVAKAAKLMGAGLAAGLGGSVFAATKFESAFAEVRKTVDTNEKGFKRLNRGLLDLSERIPVSANQLAELAGEAGALGVRSRDIVTFTKTASQLGTTTNLSAEQAANSLARLSNIMDSRGRKSFQRMGSTLVDLGNKGASTEDEIAEMSLRIAGAGKAVGLTESQVLGLAAALANVGIRAEAGGSAISRVMLEIQDAVAGGGERLEHFADLAGVSTERFAQLARKDLPAAIGLLADGLGAVSEEGGSASAVLKELGLNEIRVRDTLLRLAGNTKNFTSTQRIANRAWKENNALSKEARERYKTFESQLTLLKNTIVRTGIDIGTKFLPDLKEIVGILRSPKLTLDEKVEQLGQKLGDMIAEWGPKIAEAAGRVGLQLARGMGRAFLEAPIWGKLIMGGLLIRAIGGKGAVLKLGSTIGAWLGIGTAAGMAGGGAGGRAAAGAAAGAMAGGIGAKIGAVLKGIKWARVGVLAAGAGIAATVLEGFERHARLHSEDVVERVMANLDDMRPGVPGGVIERLFGESDMTKRERELRPIADHLVRLIKAGRTIDIARYERFREAISGITFDPKLRRDMNLLLEMAGGPIARATKQIRENFEGAFRLDELVAINKSNLATIAANFGRNSREARILVERNKDAIADHIDSLVSSGRISMEQAQRFLKRFGLTMDDLRPTISRMSQRAREAFAGVGEDADRMREKFRKLDAKANEHFKGVGDGALKLKPIFGDVSQKARRAFAGVERKSDDMAAKVSGNVGGLVGNISGGLKTLGENVNNALKAFGAKPVKFQIKSHRTLDAREKVLFKQRGGSIDIGRPSGDSVPAMLERGEYVLNRNAVAAIGKDKLDAINFGKHARFQKGGLVQAVPRFQTGGLAGGISKLANSIAKRFGLVISSGYRPGDPGHHGQGLAADIAGPVDAMNRASAYINSSGIWRRLLEGIYSGTPPLSVQSGQRVPPSFWGASTWAGHADHLHLALSGAMGPVAQQLARLTLQGPEGPLREMGQAMLDRARRAANRFLMRAMPKQGVESSGGLPKARIASIWRRANPKLGNANLMAAIALAESGGIPTAVGHDPGGTQGLGLWQITTRYNDDLIAKYGGRNAMFNPLLNAKAAGDILRRQGLGAWVVYNTGAYRQFLQRGGMALPSLDTGGRVTKAGIAEVHPGDVHRGPGGQPEVRVIVHGTIITEDDLDNAISVQIADAAPQIAEYVLEQGGRNRARARQLAGRGGRA